MKITMDMLAFLLQEKERVDEPEQAGRILYARFDVPDREVRHIRLLPGRSEAGPRSGGHVAPGCKSAPETDDTLYVTDSEDFLRADGCGRGKRQLIVARKPSGSSGPEVDQSLFREAENCLVYETEMDEQMFMECLQDLMQELLQWELSLTNGILTLASAEELFSLGRQVLRRDYAIVDVDMKLAYCTEGYAKSRQLTDGRLSEELFQSLVSRRDFHEVAAERKSFYFTNLQDGGRIICHYIFAGGQYISRLVMLLGTEEETLQSGGVRLFEFFAKQVQFIYSHMNLMQGHHSADNMHSLCRSLLAGTMTDPAVQKAVLRTYEWDSGHRFTAVVLRFFSGDGWDPQLLTTLPFLAVQLERLYQGSCAVQSEKEIVLVVNFDSPAQPGTDSSLQKGFWQPLAYFVRDNMCKAGISPAFSDFSRFTDAVKAARAALEIGTVRDPDFWYYRFDDYRLSFVVTELQKTLSPQMLCHPALDILAAYDREHSADLFETLRMFLLCNMNMTTAAGKLFIHRTSFCRRMNQVLALTKLNLDDPDTVFSLQLSYRLIGPEIERR